MELYTINATPVRSYKQLPDELKRDISRNRDRLYAINKRELDFYPDTVASVLSDHGIDGFTIFEVKGYWQGESEVSFKIEIATDKETTIIRLCQILRDKYNQEAVMLTYPDNSVSFI